MLNRWPDDNVAAIRARHRAADQNYFLVLAHLQHLEVLHRHTFVTHVTRHAHVLEHATRRGTVTDGAVAAVGLGAVGRTLAGEVVLLHYALEAFTLRAT